MEFRANDIMDDVSAEIDEHYKLKTVNLPEGQDGKIDIDSFQVKDGEKFLLGNNDAKTIKIGTINADKNTSMEIQGRNDGGVTKIEDVYGGDNAVLGGLILL